MTPPTRHPESKGRPELSRAYERDEPPNWIDLGIFALMRTSMRNWGSHWIANHISGEFWQCRSRRTTANAEQDNLARLGILERLAQPLYA